MPATSDGRDARTARIVARVRAIPAGFVRTYGDIDPRAPRLVGHILATTHEDIPWHRVVHADGSIPMGRRQRALLRQEGAIILAMEALPLADVKNRLSEVVDRVTRQHDRVTITRNGRPVAVLVSPDDLEALEETLSILSDRRELSALGRGLADLDASRTVSLKDLKADLGLDE